MRQVLFGRKDEWERCIRSALATSAFEVTFSDLRLVDLSGYDLIVPLMLADYPVLHRARAAVTGRAVFPESETVALCHDKARFNRTVAESGLDRLIPTVFTAVPSRFPFILKRAEDDYGVHSHLIRNGDDVARFAPLIADGAYFMQDYVAGAVDRSTHLLVRDGQIRHAVNVVFEMEAPAFVRGCGCFPRATRLDPEMGHLPDFEAILDAVGFRNGTCCFDYKLGPDGPKIFELNPRFGGSLTWDLAAYLRAYDDAVRIPA